MCIFNILLIEYILISPMQAKKHKSSHIVHILTQKTCMKFIPQSFKKPLLKVQSQIVEAKKPVSQVISRFSLSSIFWGGKGKSLEEVPTAEEDGGAGENGVVSKSMVTQGEAQSMSMIPQDANKQPEKSPHPNYKLKFAQKMSAQLLLIGNQFQLDLIYIAGINTNRYVQTEYLWSFRYKDPITHVSLDQKSVLEHNLLAIAAGKKVYIYKYDAKKMQDLGEQLAPFIEIQIQGNLRFLQVAKDGNICLFYEERAEIYIVGEQIRCRYNKPYAKPPGLLEGSSFSLFIVPDSFENIINVFFQERNQEKSKTFTLWCTEFQFLASQIKASAPQKIYDVKTSFRKSLTIKNYSKEVFLMNLGNEILALKRGYILDSATVNLKNQESYLEYIGNETLLHISQKKIEVYQFCVNMINKPYRIIIKPKDSIRMPSNDETDQFFKVFILMNDFFALFQKRMKNYKSGEIQYSFYITRETTRQEKMNQLFPKGLAEDIKINDPVLLDKCDMAQKMGFTTREIYLQLWSRSPQNRPQDYDILTATKDYNTIKDQIIRKLKKSSMLFSEVKKLQEDCFEMLKHKVFSPFCTEDAVMDFISSHFFLKKLILYKDAVDIEKKERQKLGLEVELKPKMPIREYQEHKSMEIRTELISLVNQFCHEGKKEGITKIRLLLKNFKFVYRIIYYQLLDEIIRTAKNQLLRLLQEIPELLPYDPQIPQNGYQADFYQGVWPEINGDEWKNSLYIDAITTIDNREIVLEQVIKNVNFKRGFLSQHGMVTESVEKIKENYLKIKSPLTFYYFIAKMFEYIKDKPVLDKIVQFLEHTYVAQLPANIKGTVFLMQRMYRHFVSKNIVPEINGRPLTLNQFLAFEDRQYIRHCFDKERSNKGLLLKDMKDIFKQVLHEQANQRYNIALLNYFTSDLSQVSDLKYILNRINNQKVEFHQENQEMYEVLVEALERKLKIGTDDDIPIEQVLIYIENIPLRSGLPVESKSLTELKAVQKIEKDSQLLRDAKVNMSIYDILNDSEKVFNKLVGHALDTAPEETWDDFDKFNKFVVEHIAQIQTFAQQVYPAKQDETEPTEAQKAIFFIFLIKLCQKRERIKFADYMLKNVNFKQRVGPHTVQAFVPFMKKWKLTSQKEYIKNQQYIKQLLTLLPQDSNFYTYIKCQFQFAKILSCPAKPVTYPIFETHLTGSDVRDIIYQLPIQFALTVPIEELYQTIETMQNILLEDMAEQQNQQGQYMSITNKISLHQIYEYFIIKFINCNKLKEVLPLIRKLLELEIADTTYNIVYMIIFVINVSGEFNEGSRNNLMLCVWYYFYHPMGLLEIFQHIMNNPLSSREVKCYIEESLAKGKTLSKGYNEENPIFDQDYLHEIHNPSTQASFMLTLQKVCKHIQHSKQQFKNIKYAAIMVMLCNSPYALAKYISCSYSYDLNVRSIRSFLSYAIKEVVFKPLALLEMGRRVFIVLLEAAQTKEPVEVVIERYSEYEIEQELDVQGDFKKDTYEYLMSKSVQAFKKKKQTLLKELVKPKSPTESAIQKSQRLRSELDKVPDIDRMDPFDYPFGDSDNDIDAGVEIDETKSKKKQTPKFDASQEMKMALKSGKSHKLFMSTRGEMSNRTPTNLLVSIRQPYKSAENPDKDKKLNIVTTEKKSKFKPRLEHRQSQHFSDEQQIRGSQCQTDRDQKLRPSHSAIDSEPRHSADSSPDIMINNKFSDNIMQSLGKIAHNSQQLIQIQLEGNDANEKVNKSKSHSHSGRSRSFEQNQLVQEDIAENPAYEIKIKEVYDIDDMMEMNKNIPEIANWKDESPQIMMESVEFQNPVVKILEKLFEANKESLENPMADLDFSALKPYEHDKSTLILVLREMYKQYCTRPDFHKIMKIMGGIVHNFPACGLDAEIFSTIIKAQEAQVKTIPEIKFTELISETALCGQYNSKRHLFQRIYENLSKHVDSENIYKITQFIRRVFDNNPDFEQEVTWDFILELADKLQNCQQEDRNWNLQKIQANLPKVDLGVWVRKIDTFESKVLFSPFKDALLEIFCGYLKTREGSYEAIQFLKAIKELDESPIIGETLTYLETVN